LQLDKGGGRGLEWGMSEGGLAGGDAPMHTHIHTHTPQLDATDAPCHTCPPGPPGAWTGGRRRRHVLARPAPGRWCPGSSPGVPPGPRAHPHPSHLPLSLQIPRRRPPLAASGQTRRPGCGVRGRRRHTMLSRARAVAHVGAGDPLPPHPRTFMNTRKKATLLMPLGVSTPASNISLA
jgi:hypothetical protein